MNRRRLMGGDLHEYVDLGLPSGTLWATCNIGAEKPEDYGLLFFWGMPETGYPADNTQVTLPYTSSTYAQADNYKISRAGDLPYDKDHDEALYNWGGRWSRPTKDQFEELCSYCDYSYIDDYNGTGVSGVLFETWLPGEDEDIRKELFLPSAGERGIFNYGSWDNGDYLCEYQTRNAERGNIWAFIAKSDGTFYSSNKYSGTGYAYPVRPVISGGGKLTLWKRILRLFKKGGGVC